MYELFRSTKKDRCPGGTMMGGGASCVRAHGQCLLDRTAHTRPVRPYLSLPCAEVDVKHGRGHFSDATVGSVIRTRGHIARAVAVAVADPRVGAARAAVLGRVR
jgi:hypothetical protein